MSAPLVTSPPPVQPLVPRHEGNNLANICRDIVEAAVVQIQDKSYLKVEGWESIAAADHCTPEIVKVECVSVMKGGIEVQGVRAEAVLKRDSDGYIISRGFGFVGEDEYLDPDSVNYYAMEAKAQTRAVSRVCRHKYAFVLLLIDKNILTTPADEVPPSGFPQGGQVRNYRLRPAAPSLPARTQGAPPAQEPQNREGIAAPRTAQGPAGTGAWTDNGNLWDGVIKNVAIKTGIKQSGSQAGQPYQLYIITLVDGREAVTFDDKLGDTCAKAVGYQCTLAVKPSKNRPGKFVASELLPARNHKETLPDLGPNLDDQDYDE